MAQAAFNWLILTMMANPTYYIPAAITVISQLC